MRLIFEAFLVSLSTVLFDIGIDYLRAKKDVKLSYTTITITRFLVHLVLGYIGMKRVFMYMLV